MFSVNFFIFLFIIIILTVGIKQATAKANKQKDSFWKNEALSNSTRKVNIDSLDYIQPDYNSLPFNKYHEPQLEETEKLISDLFTHKILNLTGITNTQLKLEYGVGNLTFLTECDQNYTSLVRLIYQWGEQLYNLKYVEDSKRVLEYGIDINSDISKNYTLLGEIYMLTCESDKIDELINKAENINSLMKKSIINNLYNIKSN